MGLIPIVPAHYWVERDVTQPTHEPPLQSGPCRLTKVSRQGRYFRYTRVPDYWGRDLPINRGRFNFDTIRYERHLEAVVAREALRAGLIDVWTENDSRHWLFSYNVPARERGWLRKGTLGSGAVRGSRFRLVLNTRRQPFDDPLVREALAHAFDFEWQNRALHGGERRRAYRLLGQVRTTRPARQDVHCGVPGWLVVRREESRSHRRGTVTNLCAPVRRLPEVHETPRVRPYGRFYGAGSSVHHRIPFC